MHKYNQVNHKNKGKNKETSSKKLQKQEFKEKCEQKQKQNQKKKMFKSVKLQPSYCCRPRQQHQKLEDPEQNYYQACSRLYIQPRALMCTNVFKSRTLTVEWRVCNILFPITLPHTLVCGMSCNLLIFRSRLRCSFAPLSYLH